MKSPEVYSIFVYLLSYLGHYYFSAADVLLLVQVANMSSGDTLVPV